MQFVAKLPTYPSPNSKLTFTSHPRQNVGLWEGQEGSFPESYIFLPFIPVFDFFQAKKGQVWFHWIDIWEER